MITVEEFEFGVILLALVGVVTLVKRELEIRKRVTRINKYNYALRKFYQLMNKQRDGKDAD